MRWGIVVFFASVCGWCAPRFSYMRIDAHGSAYMRIIRMNRMDPQPHGQLYFKCCFKRFASNAIHEVLSQMLHYYMLIRFFSWMWRGAFLKKRRQTLHCKTTLDALVRMRWRTTLSLLRWPRQACGFSKLVLFPHISHRHEICQTFYTSRLLTKFFLPESA